MQVWYRGVRAEKCGATAFRCFSKQWREEQGLAPFSVNRGEVEGCDQLFLNLFFLFSRRGVLSAPPSFMPLTLPPNFPAADLNKKPLLSLPFIPNLLKLPPHPLTSGTHPSPNELSQFFFSSFFFQNFSKMAPLTNPNPPAMTTLEFLGTRPISPGVGLSQGIGSPEGHPQDRGHRTPSLGSASTTQGRISMSTLVVLVFYGVSGGPFGIEAAVGAGGSFVAIAGFLLLPFIWAIPEALVTAELSTTFPEASGFVAWVETAHGPFLGFMEGYMSWMSGVTDNSLYPVLFLEYLTAVYPSLDRPEIRLPAIYVMVFLLVFLNYKGLEVVGKASLLIGLFSLSPFVIMTFLGMKDMDLSRLSLPPAGGGWEEGWMDRVDVPLFLNLMFWNFNYWDSAAVFAGEVGDAANTFPKAMGIALIMVVLAYALPIIVGVGATRDSMSSWTDGHFAVVGEELGGKWLALWIVIAAAVSNVGMFIAELSSDSFQIMGMAERGMIPACFGRRSRNGTPTYALLMSAVGICVLSAYDFHEIIEMLNFLYCFAELLEFSAFIKLRFTRKSLHRPFKIPLGDVGCCVMLVPPVALILVLMGMASRKTWVMCGGAVAFGVVLYWGLAFLRINNLVRFSCKHKTHEASESETEVTPLLTARASTKHLHTAFEDLPLDGPDHLVTGKRGRSPMIGFMPHPHHAHSPTSLQLK